MGLLRNKSKRQVSALGRKGWGMGNEENKKGKWICWGINNKRPGSALGQKGGGMEIRKIRKINWAVGE